MSALLADFGPDTRDSQLVLPARSLLDEAFGDPHNRFYAALAAVTAACKPKTIVEVGTYLGVGTLTLAKNAPSAQIITIDLPNSSLGPKQLGPDDRSHVERSRGRIGITFRESEEARRISQVLQDSTTVSFAELVGEADLVLIDGGHSYDIVAADSQNALSVLSPAGVILWDDYAYFYPEVVRFLDQLSRDIPLKRIAGTNLVIYRGEKSSTHMSR